MVGSHRRQGVGSRAGRDGRQIPNQGVTIMNRLKEIMKRKAEIRALLESGDDADLDALEAELNELNDEETKLRKRQSMAQAINTGEVPTDPVENPAAPEQRGSETDPTRSLEYR